MTSVFIGYLYWKKNQTQAGIQYESRTDWKLQNGEMEARPSEIVAGQGGKSGYESSELSAGGTRKAYGPLDYPPGCFVVVVFNIHGFTWAFKNK